MKTKFTFIVGSTAVIVGIVFAVLAQSIAFVSFLEMMSFLVWCGGVAVCLLFPFGPSVRGKLR